MRGFGIWVVVGLAGLVAVIATPASAQGGAAPAAVVDTVKARAVRWVLAARVRLRGAPAADAPVLGGVEINTPLTLRSTVGDWCEVQGFDGTRGYVACRFLGEQALDLEAITSTYTPAGSWNPEYDPARHFALQPTWSTVEQYAFALDERRRQAGEAGLPAPDPALEAMKVELEKGAYGPPQPARRDVEDLQVFVVEALQTGEPEVRKAAANDVREALQLWSEDFHDGSERALAVALAIELPPVRLSYFVDEGALAAPGDTPEQLSGRFGIVHRWVTTPAKRARDENDTPIALYDMAAVTNLLVRPLQRVQLFNDGSLRSVPSHAREQRSLHEYEHGMCENWTPGFLHGELDATDPAWASFGDWLPSAHDDAAQPAGSLYAFYAQGAPTRAKASVSLVEQAMDREATGFTLATTRLFDIDHDAVPDLLVWEGTGHGPGHMDGPTTTDDTWYRLVLANIGGRWKVLGTDQFSYGCGC